MSYVVALIGLGVIVLLTAWLPFVLRQLPLSLPIFCVALGAALFASVGTPAPLPYDAPAFTERVTEIIVIIALMGAGLKIDRPIGWRRWITTWRLIGIAMPLSIVGISLLGWSLLGLAIPTAILLGAALAPTDPVLASDVQVGPPRSGEEDEVRFALTSEAGLNDGLAFPFVNLAVALAVAATFAPEDWLSRWLLVDVVWKISAGIGVGYLCGRAFGWITFRIPKHLRLSTTGDGFAALGVTFVSYGLTELVMGYGFLAVFVTAVVLRAAEREHEFHRRLHDFAEQTERLATMLLLVLFGGALSSGLLSELNAMIVAFAVAVLLIIRPLAGWVSMVGLSRPASEKWVISFFGIRGVGSAYYLAYGLNKADFQQAELLWSVVAVVVLASIVMHGSSATPVMRWLDRRQAARRTR